MAHKLAIAQSVTKALREQVDFQRKDVDEVKATQLEDSYLSALRYIEERPELGLSIKQLPGNIRKVQLSHFQYFLYYKYDKQSIFVFALRHKKQWQDPGVIRGLLEDAEIDR
jgi:plasmid stabilization system protein ParE